MARSVDMVNLLRVAAAREVMKREPHLWMWLIIRELTACSVKDSGSSTERYQQKPVCSVGSRVVSFHGFPVCIVAGQVFLER